MNRDLLLNHFDRISEAPDAIPRLRRFILDLAVRGKLVEQDSSDEPASELLIRIQAEKARLVTEGRIRKQIVQPDIDPASSPFLLPKGWIWARLGDVIQLLSGQHLQPGEYSEQKDGGLPYITGPADFAKNGLVITRHALVKKAIAKKGQILLTVKGAGVGKTAICNLPEVAISRQLMAMTAIEWSQQFLLLTTHRLATALIESARSLIPGISREDVDQFIFPLPPLVEQHRIVTKVDELMALCDRLERECSEQEERRDRLAAASLHRLIDDANAEAFPQKAQFHLANLPRLTTRPVHIQQLRRALYNLAVRGKLVAQDHPDETGVEHLKHIRSERVRLEKEGKMKLLPSLHPIDDSQVPFRLPKSWVWVRFGELITDADAGWSPKTEGFPRLGRNWGVLKVSAVSWNKFLPEENKQLLPGVVPPEAAQVHAGDFLISRANTSELVAKCVLVEQEPQNLILSDKIVRLQISESCSKKFLSIVNNHATHARAYYAEEASGTSLSMKNVSRAVIYGLLIPLPPLSEQRRIVAKIEQVTALCDQLEAQLTTTQSEKRKLLEAVLHHALSDRNEHGSRMDLLTSDRQLLPNGAAV